MKLLIVDDDVDTCTLLKIFFEKRGCTVFSANSLIEGLHIIDANELTAVFIDNYLPDGEGWEAAKKIKIKYPDLNINLMSAKDRSFSSLDQYSDVIWEKPITMGQLETYMNFLSKSSR